MFEMGHYPRGGRYTALEKNVLKFRAFEMLLLLFRVEWLRSFVIESIRGTDRFRSGPPRLPEGTKRPLKRAWDILVDDGIITSEESAELQQLIDYRNIVAHATERLTVDVHRAWADRMIEVGSYDGKAVSKLEALAKKIEAGMSSKYMITLSLKPYMFEPAERAYKEELHRLRRKIDRQLAVLKTEIHEVNANIASLPPTLLKRFEPGDPRNISRNGTLSRKGVECCYALFGAGATPLAVAYLMRISLRSAKARFTRWEEEGAIAPADCDA